MRKETKIGIFTIVTILLAIWGFNFLRGFDLLASKTTLRAEYPSIDGLRISAPVRVNGLKVGLVADFKQMDNNINRLDVVMEIDKGVQIPKSAVAEIYTPSPMGGAEIRLVFEGNCSGADCAQDGDRLRGVNKGLLGSMATPDEFRVYVDELNDGLQKVLDTLNMRLAQSDEIQESVRDVRTILTNLKSTTGRLDRLMAGSSGSIEGSLKNVEAITANLKANNEKIATIMANAETLTTELKDAKMGELAGSARQSMDQMKATLASSDRAIKELEAVLKSINAGGDGAVAMLLHDKEFADNLQLTVKNLDLLMQDIRLHPERYRRILSKKKMPYEAPENDPGLKD